MISEAQFFMGRDERYRDELSDEIQANARLTLERLNSALALAAAEGIVPGVDPDTGTAVSSGWRPAAVNGATPNAAPNSTHIGAKACDIRDTPERELARWCLRNQDKLAAIGLWMEDPRWTPSWVHLQIVPPRSGNRVFVPSDAPALAAALPEQLETAHG